MAADYSFSFTNTAATDLDETLNYISGELSNPIAAQSFLQKMETTISAIRTSPLSGSPVENPYVKRNNIRKTMVGNYVLYYLPVAFAFRFCFSISETKPDVCRRYGSASVIRARKRAIYLRF